MKLGLTKSNFLFVKNMTIATESNFVRKADAVLHLSSPSPSRLSQKNLAFPKTPMLILLKLAQSTLIRGLPWKE